MANSNGWGDGSVNNDIGWGQGANNNIGWGKSHLNSWSGATDIDGGNPPVNSVAPALSGTAQEGQTLTCSTGTWSGSPTYTYQWKRDGNNITSATNSTYTLVTADVGTSIKCTVTATNFTGSATADSNTVVPVSAFSYLLDTYSGSSAAYSLRKLSSTYSGSAIRVRRSIDNTEQDFGFVNNVLDTASLLTFCGAGNGFVTTWYDQSGNSRNAINTTALQQPQIVSSGAVLLTNGKPSIKFNNANNNNLLYNSNLFLGANSRTILSVYKPNNSSGTFSYGIFGQSGSTNAGSWTVLQSRTQFVTGDPYFAGYSADLGNGLSTPNTSQKLAQFNYNGATGYLYKNNSLLTSSNITLNALSSGQTYVGTSFSGASFEYALADIQECIAWGSNQDSNTSGISNNINSFYTIY